jgi:hypothetical protein
MLSAAIFKEQPLFYWEERATEHPANGSFRHEPKEIWSSLTAD